MRERTAHERGVQHPRQNEICNISPAPGEQAAILAARHGAPDELPDVSTALPYSDYLDLVPKVELHLHIAGAVRASTLIDIATANGVRMPRPAETLYQWQDFYGFLELLRLGALAVRRPD